MSEFIDNHTGRIEALAEFALRLIRGENGKMLIEHYSVEIALVTPTSAMQVLDKLLTTGLSIETVKANTGKIINVFYKPLSAWQWAKPEKGHFINNLMLENREVEKLMAELKTVTKTYFNGDNSGEGNLPTRFRSLVQQLKQYELHYIKKEIILFPYLEKAFPGYRCLQLMWSFHDDFRKSLKVLGKMLNSEKPDKNLLNKELGKLFFVVLPIIFREEQIVFPVAMRAIPEEDWAAMMQQSFETGWCYMETPANDAAQKSADFIPDGLVNLGTGSLRPEQIVLMLENLPLDITFVDENDEVRYFSGAKHRIFPRSKAIIGRKVQNCHPPESVHVVNEIVSAFRNGQKEHADFWIQMKGHFVHIRYFALRDEHGAYRGTIEVSQDVTEIRTLEGESRLLDWNLQ
jgi:DUF438 domain-containing protein